MSVPARGGVFKKGRGVVVVVSNDLRNEAMPTVLVARVTTAARPSIPSAVALPVGEPAVGQVMCDQITEIPAASLGAHVGALSRPAMRAVDEALRVALAL